MNAADALAKLIAGNQKFVTEASQSGVHSFPILHNEMQIEQQPFAIVLGCSDARVPAELVFYQGLGDLFVIRVAGNIVAPSQIGSIEFACQQFGVQLVVVLGHTHCGAIQATVDALTGDPDDLSPNVAAIVDRVTPAVDPIVRSHQSSDRAELIQLAMQANVHQSVQLLQMRSRILRSLIRHNELKIVGAEYSIENGKVDFYLDES
jgi:carbonic anhydrase